MGHEVHLLQVLVVESREDLGHLLSDGFDGTRGADLDWIWQLPAEVIDDLEHFLEVVVLNEEAELDFGVELAVEHALHGLVLLQVLHAAFLQLGDRVHLVADPHQHLLALAAVVVVTGVHPFLSLTQGRGSGLSRAIYRNNCQLIH